MSATSASDLELLGGSGGELLKIRDFLDGDSDMGDIDLPDIAMSDELQKRVVRKLCDRRVLDVYGSVIPHRGYLSPIHLLEVAKDLLVEHIPLIASSRDEMKAVNELIRLAPNLLSIGVNFDGCVDRHPKTDDDEDWTALVSALNYASITRLWIRSSHSTKIVNALSGPFLVNLLELSLGLIPIFQDRKKATAMVGQLSRILISTVNVESHIRQFGIVLEPQMRQSFWRMRSNGNQIIVHQSRVQK